MRRDQTSKLLIICLVAACAVVILNAAALRVVRKQYAPASDTLASVFNVTGQFREWADHVRHWQSLVSENEALKEAAARQVFAQASLESLQRENEVLRKAAGLSGSLKRPVILAGMFGVSLLPDGHMALINKGAADGVVAGQAVIVADGVLVGTVTNVFGSSARVRLATDLNFSVTARVVGGSASGILRGALSEGMDLALVTQEESILEGDVLMTTGDDAVPAGLIVGVVRNVQDNDTQLFKKVSVNPATDFRQGGVIVVGK